MSWFTENIRDPIENKLSGTKPAAPSVPTANSAPATAPGMHVSIMLIIGVVVLFFILKKAV